MQHYRASSKSLLLSLEGLHHNFDLAHIRAPLTT
jgi:hypothetical protein